jgi:CRP-like cAMP-binding protein
VTRDFNDCDAGLTVLGWVEIVQIAVIHILNNRFHSLYARPHFHWFPSMAIQYFDQFDIDAFIAEYGGTISKYTEGETVFTQGDPADAIFYIVSGAVKMTITSDNGREAVIAILTEGNFFGSNSLNWQEQRPSTNITTTVSEIARFDQAAFDRALDNDPVFSKSFLKFVVDWNHKLLDNLVEQFFHSSEERLARILMTLANFGPGQESSFIAASISQEMLASMVGTTRSRINQFMNKFRKLGYIDYNGKIKVNNSLSNLILHDPPNGDDQP